MRINTFIAIGAIFAIVGLLGLTYVFPKMMCISGQEFVDQIDTSSGLEKYEDYSIGDTVTISDSIARMELSDGQTLIWLETIGKSESDPPFRFGSNIMGDFGIGNSIIIKFEVVQDSSGDFTLKGYENGGSGLSSDAISARYSTVNEYIFMILILGGISSGQNIVASFAVKPTSSILTSRKTIDKKGKNTNISVKGRHDPCVGIRAVPIGEAMISCVILDHLLMHRAQCG